MAASGGSPISPDSVTRTLGIRSSPTAVDLRMFFVRITKACEPITCDERVRIRPRDYVCCVRSRTQEWYRKP
jgi:hypothetical protein